MGRIATPWWGLLAVFLAIVPLSWGGSGDATLEPSTLEPSALEPCVWNEQTPEGLYLVTLAPGASINAVFGHTQLLDWDPDRGLKSRVYDFGYFDPSDPDFVWNFLSNQQDYQLRAGSLGRTIRIYGDKLGRQGVAQRLAVDARTQRQVIGELKRRLAERDGFFRYHWYDSNCTTEVRDVLAVGLGPDFEGQQHASSEASPRSEVLRHSADHPLWFGLHWGSGLYADVRIDHWDRMFIPETLMRRAEETTHRGRPLVASRCRITDGPRGFAAPHPPRRDGLLIGVGLLGALLLGGIGWVAPKTGLGLTALWGLATGLFGSAALLVGVLGTFAPFWGHHNLLLASPASLLLTVGAVGRLVRRASRWPRILAGMVGVLYVLAVLLAVVRLGGDHSIGLIGLFLCNAVGAALIVHSPKTG